MRSTLALIVALTLTALQARTDEVLAFPMSIVPTFVAPFFIGLHAAALLCLARESRNASNTSEQ